MYYAGLPALCESWCAMLPEWTKVLTLIVGLTVWSAVVVVTLVQGKLPDATTLGIPAALVLALAPPISLGRGRGQRRDRTEAPATDREAS